MKNGSKIVSQEIFARGPLSTAAEFGASTGETGVNMQISEDKTRNLLSGIANTKKHAVRLLLASTTIRINIILDMQSRQKRSGSNRNAHGLGVCHGDGTGARKKLRKKERIRINKASQNGTFQN